LCLCKLLYDPEHCDSLGLVLLTNFPDAPNNRLVIVPVKEANNRELWKAENLLPHDINYYIRCFVVVRGFVVVERVRVSDMTDELFVIAIENRNKNYIVNIPSDTAPFYANICDEGYFTDCYG
jgi:hypothetical protein